MEDDVHNQSIRSDFVQSQMRPANKLEMIVDRAESGKDQMQGSPQKQDCVKSDLVIEYDDGVSADEDENEKVGADDDQKTISLISDTNEMHGRQGNEANEILDSSHSNSMKEGSSSLIENNATPMVPLATLEMLASENSEMKVDLEVKQAQITEYKYII